MEIKILKHRDDFADHSNLDQAQMQFTELIQELNHKNIPDKTVKIINLHISELNSSTQKGKDFRKLLTKKQNKIVKFLEKEHKIVPKNYYRNIWMALGLAAFGIPIGVAFGLNLGNGGLSALAYLLDWSWVLQ